MDLRGTLTPARRQLGRLRRATTHAGRRATAGSRPLPAFLIPGAQKAGTTSLLAYLEQHPQVTPPVTKEPHFFDLAFDRGLMWYRSFFRPQDAGHITCEASPYYLFHPLVPERVAQCLPNVKCLVLLRNPIDRAVSHHNHERVLGFEQLPFEEALAREPRRLTGEEERISRDPAYSSFAHGHYSYFSRGVYADQLERWFAHLPRHQFLILQSEHLFTDPAATMRRAHAFLGLPPAEVADTSPHYSRHYAPIDAALRRQLHARFEPHNRRLYELIGEEFDWEEAGP